MPYLFIGERRSPTAIRMGVTWRDDNLCAKTLRDALRVAGIDPDAGHQFLNLWDDQGEPHHPTLERCWWAGHDGFTVVALGGRVQRALLRHRVPFLALTHPAARGRIRATARYQAHVAEVLGAASQPITEEEVHP